MKREIFENLAKKLYFQRNENAIKSDNGKALLIGSSRNFPNATLIASECAVLSGNGYNAVSVPDSVYPVVFSRVSPLCIHQEIPCSMDDFLLDDFSYLKKYDSVLFGNGVSVSEKNYQFLKGLIENAENNLVLDASALRLLSEYGSDILKSKKKESKILLTPHLGEAGALLHENLHSKDPNDYLLKAKEFAQKYDVSILLKSVSSILVLPDGNSFRSDYSPTVSLAKAGSGDGLSGYITGLLSFAMKYVSYQDVILFADMMIHLSMSELEKINSPSLYSILSLREGMKIVLNRLKKEE